MTLKKLAGSPGENLEMWEVQKNEFTLDGSPQG